MPGPGGSPAERWCHELVELGGEIGDALAELTVVEQAALAYDWDGWWARPEQIIADGPWRSHGFCTGRRFGKSRANAQYVHREAMAGRAMRIALIAQDEERAILDMVEGDSGLFAVAPPWERPVWENGQIRWPNGALASIFTPERPGKIRGPGVHLSWACEIIAWPAAKRAEAWSNLRLMTSLGYARTLWDTTPKKCHPILRDLLAKAKAEPDLHPVVGGNSRANVANINADELDDWERSWGGTTKGREELDGEYIDEAEGALVRIEWIDAGRRVMPHRLERRIISLDPAISTRRGTDATGIVELGLGADKQLYIIDDMSGHLPCEEWARVAVERYVSSRCDCLVIERNRGGDLNVGNIRGYCRMQRPPIQVQVVKAEAVTRHVAGTVYVKEVIGRESKESRLGAVAPFYEKGLVSHVEGADLADLEDELTMWEPEAGGPSPNRLDAMVHGAWELAGLARDTPGKATAAGIDQLRAALKAGPGARRPASGLLRVDLGRAGRL